MHHLASRGWFLPRMSPLVCVSFRPSKPTYPAHVLHLSSGTTYIQNSLGMNALTLVTERRAPYPGNLAVVLTMGELVAYLVDKYD
jgi:hypothetical protein